MTKLYVAGSLIDRFGEFDRVTVFWYRQGRSEPIVPYDQAIAGYEGLDDEERRHAERTLDALFTEWEMNELASFTHKRHKAGLVIAEVALPMPNDLEGPDDFIGDNVFAYYASSNPECSLSFPVLGLFKLTEANRHVPRFSLRRHQGALPVGVTCCLCGEPLEPSQTSFRLFDERTLIGPVCAACEESGPKQAGIRAAQYETRLRLRYESVGELAANLQDLPEWPKGGSAGPHARSRGPRAGG